MFDVIAVHALFQVASVPKFYRLNFIKYVIVCDTTSTTSKLPSPYSIEVSKVSSPRDISSSAKVTRRQRFRKDALQIAKTYVTTTLSSVYVSLRYIS